MSIESLKANIKREKELADRMQQLSEKYASARESEKKDINEAIESAKKQIFILNNSLPDLIKNIYLVKKLSGSMNAVKGEIISVSHFEGENEKLLAINKKDRGEYLKQLHISETSLKNLKKERERTAEIFSTQFRKPSRYIKISNKFFSRTVINLVNKGHFKKLQKDLEKGNFMILLNSYISSMFFATTISIFAGILVTVFFMFFGVISEPPFLYIVSYANSLDILIRILEFGWLIFAFPILTFLAFYFYPSAEKSSIESEIEYELPFATIQMAAVASANIEPTNIFRIIALSKEYPNVRNESKKLMNQINLYGYDLVNALKNVASVSPSKEWAELLNGISTTIRSGGDLAKFLQKRAETMLFEYRLKREKATKAAETFMDIYISVVIAAPMMLMLVLVMLNMSKVGVGLSTGMLTIIIVSIIALINIIFLAALQSKKNRM